MISWLSSMYIAYWSTFESPIVVEVVAEAVTITPLPITMPMPVADAAP